MRGLSLPSLGPFATNDGECPVTVAQGHMPTGRHHLAAEREVRWPNLTRIVFRFGFACVLLFLGSFAAFFTPLTIPISALSEAVWGAVVPWVAREILLLPSPPLISDGDGLGQWIQVGGCLVGAGVTTMVWSVLDRRRSSYVTLHDWLQVILRYALGIAMVTCTEWRRSPIFRCFRRTSRNSCNRWETPLRRRCSGSSWAPRPPTRCSRE